MQRYKILHRTYYNFTGEVWLEPHTLRLRPREGHELRVESSELKITPDASLRWHRDVEDNSVAIATFGSHTDQLVIENEVYRVTMLHGDYSVQIGENLKAGEPVGTESNLGNTTDMQGNSCRNRDCGYHTHRGDQ